MGATSVERLETIFGLKIIKFFVADPGPGSGIFLTQSGTEKFGSGIRDKHLGSAKIGATFIFCGKRWHSRFGNKILITRLEVDIAEVLLTCEIKVTIQMT